jgi:hypothetical protein
MEVAALIHSQGGAQPRALITLSKRGGLAAVPSSAVKQSQPREGGVKGLSWSFEFVYRVLGETDELV